MGICTASTVLGAGGVAGGAGDQGSVAYNNTAMSTSMGVPVIKVISGMPTSLSVSLTEDIFGDIPVDIPEDATITMVAKPCKDTYDTVLKKECTNSGNTVTVDISENDLPKAGLYPVAFIITNADGTPHSEHQGYLYVEQGMNQWSEVSNDPISISDVRMALMDYSAEANVLLNDLEFSDIQIISAMKRPIREWNETPPDIRTYNFNNFPWPEAWLKATCSYLLESAAYKYNRNTIPHNASGLSMDPNNKGALYLQTAMNLRNEWKAWIMAKKTELNIMDCWGVTSIGVYGDMDYYG